MPLAWIRPRTLREVAHLGLCQIVTAMPWRLPPGRAADIDHVAVAVGGVRVDVAGDQHPAVEGDDLTILGAAPGLVGRANVIFAVRAALEAQLGRLTPVGQVQHDRTAPHY